MMPAGTTIYYGFQITQRRGLFDIVHAVWDGNHRETPSDDRVTEVEGAVILNKDLLEVLDRRLYFLAGVGVLLGTWLVLFFFLGFVDQRKEGVSVLRWTS